MRCLYLMTQMQMPEMVPQVKGQPRTQAIFSYTRCAATRSKGTYTREFDVIPAKGAPHWPSIVQYTRVRVKTRYLEKFKINISTRRIHTKLSTRKRLNTKSVLLI